MATEAQETVTRYVTGALHYMENALVLLQRREASKAGEMFWGGVATALQAVAASRGTQLANHRSLRFFAGQLAKELRDPSLNEGFRLAESLHSKFYEVDLEPTDVAGVVEPIRRTVARLLALIPRELILNPPESPA